MGRRLVIALSIVSGTLERADVEGERHGVLRGAEQLLREPVVADGKVLRRMLLEGFAGLGRDHGASARDLLLRDGLPAVAGRTSPVRNPDGSACGAAEGLNW